MRKGNTDEQEHETLDSDITLKEKKILTQEVDDDITREEEKTLTREESDEKDTIKNCLDNNEIVLNSLRS